MTWVKVLCNIRSLTCQNKVSGADDETQLVECWLSSHEILGSILSTKFVGHGGAFLAFGR